MKAERTVDSKLQEVLERIGNMEDHVLERIGNLEKEVKRLFAVVAGRRANNSNRRAAYQKRRQEELKGRLSLPEDHCLSRRDRRLQTEAAWCEAGIRFGLADQPFRFLSWLVWNWNNCTYLKKPCTFSGSSFRVWNGTHRSHLGAGDLMHYYRRPRTAASPFLRNEGERQDFSSRPWWDWGSNVLVPVIERMQDEAVWESFSDRFKLAVQLLGGGRLEVQVGGTFWDFNEDLPTLNRMIRTIMPVWNSVIEACLTGLRAAKVPMPPVPGG